jgi:iron complex transport system permease protein
MNSSPASNTLRNSPWRKPAAPPASRRLWQFAATAIVGRRVMTTCASDHRYSRLLWRRTLACAGLAVAVLCSFGFDLSTGPAPVPLLDAVRALSGVGTIDAQQELIIREMRMPIALMALLVGASLAVAGMEMQTILDNPLASPFTLGISSAAAFGAAISLVFPPSFLPETWRVLATPVLAFAFALASSFLIYAVSHWKRSHSTLLLMGIAVNFLFSSLNSGLHYYVTDQVLRSLTNWAQGNVLGANYREIAIIAMVLVLAIPILLRDAWQLTALGMGEATARSLGVRVAALRTRTLIVTALITSTAVCFVGTIGFIGLVAPYLARSLVGEEQRFLVPASLLCGALFMSIASIASKSLLANGQIPIGIVTSLLGVPFLMLLVLRGGGAQERL